MANKYSPKRQAYLDMIKELKPKISNGVYYVEVWDVCPSHILDETFKATIDTF